MGELSIADLQVHTSGKGVKLPSGDPGACV